MVTTAILEDKEFLFHQFSWTTFNRQFDAVSSDSLLKNRQERCEVEGRGMTSSRLNTLVYLCIKSCSLFVNHSRGYTQANF